MLLFAWGAALEARSHQPRTAMMGVFLSRSAQGLGPILFYIALDLRGKPWFEGVAGFFTSAPHAFLMALTLVARRQQKVIVDLLHQLKTLSRWGFGSRVVEAVLRDSGTHAASPARGPPLWEDCDAQVEGEGVEVDPNWKTNWDMAAYPANRKSPSRTGLFGGGPARQCVVTCKSRGFTRIEG
nr:hypothetical protein [Rhodoferax sp.]